MSKDNRYLGGEQRKIILRLLPFTGALMDPTQFIENTSSMAYWTKLGRHADQSSLLTVPLSWNFHVVAYVCVFLAYQLSSIR